MKKFIFFIAAMSALLSCVKENPVSDTPVVDTPVVETPAEETFCVELKATAPSDGDDAVAAHSNTKTTLVEGAKFVHWSKGDAIKVQFFANVKQPVDVTGSNGVFTSDFDSNTSASANFINESWVWGGGITDGNYGNITSRLMPEGIALYPHTVSSYSKSLSGGTATTTEISYTLPTEQPAISGNIATVLSFSYAKVGRDEFVNVVNKKASMNLTFNNACALISLTMPTSLNGKELDYILISSNSNVPLTGNGNVDVGDNGTNVVSPFHVTPEVTSESTKVKLMNVEGSPIVAGATYYAVVWPGTHDDGLTLSFCATDGTIATLTTKKVELKAAVVKPYNILSTLDFVSAQRDYKYYYANGEMGDDTNPAGTSVVGVIIYHGNPKTEFNDSQLPDQFCNGLAISVSSRKCAWNSTSISVPDGVKTSGSSNDNIKSFGIGGYTVKNAYGANNYTVFDNGSAPNNTSGWYLGTPKEWNFIYENRDNINALLDGVGETINPTTKATSYWLPVFYNTQAICVYFSNTGLTYAREPYYYYPSYSNYCYYARPIFAF